ncbi:adhesion G protein-coupled receptor F5-like [Electrophorus electricus]|uniref:adhesion G protein-coupled receptor F5-like n=1 Tax=Electrophorus electricus TaxID=8005 RepID=UPI0015D0764E|nr:adhesion G protein-coupled receptor F5-like [Electrophorus electricus]
MMCTSRHGLCGLVLICLCFCGCFGTFMVTQTPSTVKVKEGESVHITCCWNNNITWPKVKWFKDKRAIHVNSTGKIHLTETRTPNCSVLTITNTYKNDTGIYICEVIQDIPQLCHVKGTGTNLTYQEDKGCFGTFMVTQTPSTVKVKEGESVHINCCWNENITWPKVKWFKDKRAIHVNSTGKIHLTETRTPNCSVLTITNTYKNGTGIYICEVIQDIPQLCHVNGTGTNLTYQEDNVNVTIMPVSTTEATTTVLDSNTMLLGSVSSVMGLICICACLTAWKLSRKGQRAERIVIREGPPSEEEEPNISEEEQSSRGSTHWCMVPVYESYFDLQRNDDQESAVENTGSDTSEKTGSA